MPGVCIFSPRTGLGFKKSDSGRSSSHLDFPSFFVVVFLSFVCLFVFVFRILVRIPVVVLIYCCFCPFSLSVAVLPLLCFFLLFFFLLLSFFFLPLSSSSSIIFFFFLSSAPCSSCSCFYSSSYFFFFIDVTTPSETGVTDRVLLLSCLLNSTLETVTVQFFQELDFILLPVFINSSNLKSGNFSAS